MQFCCHDNTGMVLKGVLVPLEYEDRQEVQQSKETRATKSTGSAGKKLKAQEDGEFSPLRFTDHMGVAQEQRKI